MDWFCGPQTGDWIKTSSPLESSTGFTDFFIEDVGRGSSLPVRQGHTADGIELTTVIDRLGERRTQSCPSNLPSLMPTCSCGIVTTCSTRLVAAQQHKGD